MVVGSGCEVCGGHDCSHAPEVDYHDRYPFMPGGTPRVPGREGFEYVVATQPVHHPTLAVIEYGIGDRIPMQVAIERGMTVGPMPEPPPDPPKGRRR